MTDVTQQDARLVVMANQIANNVPPVGDVFYQASQQRVSNQSASASRP